jgi:cardiolipin synthase A/B
LNAIDFIVTKFLWTYWPHMVLLTSIVASITASVHAAMTKQDVRAAIGWVAVILFSPLFGALIYFIAGINRIRRERIRVKRKKSEHLTQSEEKVEIETESEVDVEAQVTRSTAKNIKDGVQASVKRLDNQSFEVSDVTQYGAQNFLGMHKLGDKVALFPLVSGNALRMLNGGDETYPAMIQAISQAKHSVAMQSYIFDHDRAGLAVAQALIEAQKRGVEVRVLIDSVGSRYSRPAITPTLLAGSVDAALFMTTYPGFRLAYANLRSHRKLLVIDGRYGLTGGMNIRESFMRQYGGDNMTHDTHFELEGPVVEQLFESFVHDWEFTTKERLSGPAWYPAKPVWKHGQDIPIRAVRSGPDRMMANNQSMLLGVLSVAQQSVRIQSPYFLPDVTLIDSLKTAARRGVVVDVVIPGNNNLKLVGAAMDAQFDQLIEVGVRVWRSQGQFDHSKLCTVDGVWSYVGSSNIDARSLRLNFELDIEVYDSKLAQTLAQRIDDVIQSGKRVTLKSLKSKPFYLRLRNRIVWLASPYL